MKQCVPYVVHNVHTLLIANYWLRLQLPSNMKTCVMCNNFINPEELTFEQRLIDDKDFCRKCWEEMANEVNEEAVPIPRLAIAS